MQYSLETTRYRRRWRGCTTIPYEETWDRYGDTFSNLNMYSLPHVRWRLRTECSMPRTTSAGKGDCRRTVFAILLCCEADIFQHDISKGKEPRLLKFDQFSHFAVFAIVWVATFSVSSSAVSLDVYKHVVSHFQLAISFLCLLVVFFFLCRQYAYPSRSLCSGVRVKFSYQWYLHSFSVPDIGYNL